MKTTNALTIFEVVSQFYTEHHDVKQKNNLLKVSNGRINTWSIQPSYEVDNAYEIESDFYKQRHIVFASDMAEKYSKYPEVLEFIEYLKTHIQFSLHDMISKLSTPVGFTFDGMTITKHGKNYLVRDKMFPTVKVLVLIDGNIDLFSNDALQIDWRNYNQNIEIEIDKVIANRNREGNESVAPFLPRVQQVIINKLNYYILVNEPPWKVVNFLYSDILEKDIDKTKEVMVTCLEHEVKLLCDINNDWHVEIYSKLNKSTLACRLHGNRIVNPSIHYPNDYSHEIDGTNSSDIIPYLTVLDIALSGFDIDSTTQI